MPEEKGQEKKKFGLSGSTLKMIAVISMLIDHVGAAFVYRSMNRLYRTRILSSEAVIAVPWYQDFDKVSLLYQVMRGIGRIAFPIYCFLLVEGLYRTRNVVKYAIRLLLFAIISEIPFDLCFENRILEFGYQNVFFTLFIGLLTTAGLKWTGEKLRDIQKLQGTWGRILQLFLGAVVIAAGAGLAHLIRCDYAARGVLCIVVIYLFYGNRIAQAVAGAVVFLWEIPAPVAFLPIAFYNGQRGWKLKIFFYAFYPVHLLLIYLACRLCGLV